MKLIDVTNSYPELVTKQLENTDSTLVRVFTLGKTTVLYTEAPKHCEIVIINKVRKIKQKEITAVLDYLLDDRVDVENQNIIKMDNLVEVSVPFKTMTQT